MGYYQTQAISASLMGEAYTKSLAHFKWGYDHWHLPTEGDDETTPAMRFGSFCHMMALQPQLLQGYYGQLPDGMRRDARTKAYQQLLGLHPGREFMTQKEWDLAGELVAAVSGYLPGPGEAEYERDYFTHYVSEHCQPLLLKARADVITIKDGVLKDLKFLADVSPRGIAAHMKKYYWPLRAAHYFKTIPGLTKYIYTFGEKNGPYISGELEIEGVLLELGMAQWERTMGRIEHGFQTGIWPGYVEAYDYRKVPELEPRSWELEIINHVEE
jgi:hypothetical protein